MGYKTIVGAIALLLYFYMSAEQETQQYDLRKTATAHHHHAKPNNAHQNSNQSANDVEVAKAAVSALTSMAMDLVGIGADPYNPQVVGVHVIGILSSFINFVTYALRNPQLVELLEQEEFRQVLRSYIIKRVAEKQAVASELEVL
jgi:hypothetical protein